jgi:hypothetical protein
VAFIGYALGILGKAYPMGVAPVARRLSGRIPSGILKAHGIDEPEAERDALAVAFFAVA